MKLDTFLLLSILFLSFPPPPKCQVFSAADNVHANYHCVNLTTVENKRSIFYHDMLNVNESNLYFLKLNEDSCESLPTPRLYMNFMSIKENCIYQGSFERYNEKVETFKEISLKRSFIIAQFKGYIYPNNTHLKFKYLKNHFQDLIFENIEGEHIHFKRNNNTDKFEIFNSVFCGFSLSGRCLAFCYSSLKIYPTVIEENRKPIVNEELNLTKGVLSNPILNDVAFQLIPFSNLPSKKVENNCNISSNRHISYIAIYALLFNIFFFLAILHI